MVTLNDAELRALDYKMEHPDEEVYCPRCGGRILYFEHGNSCRVWCEKEECIQLTLRGL